MSVPEVNIILTKIEVKEHPRKLKRIWHCKWYGDGAVLLVSPHHLVFWFYDIWYKLFPPKFEIYEIVPDKRANQQHQLTNKR